MNTPATQPKREAVSSERLTELLEKATPGPWEWRNDGEECQRKVGTPGVGLYGTALVFGDTEREADANAGIVALSPDLAREVLALRQRVADLEGEIQAINEANAGASL